MILSLNVEFISQASTYTVNKIYQGIFVGTLKDKIENVRPAVKINSKFLFVNFQ